MRKLLASTLLFTLILFACNRQPAGEETDGSKQDVPKTVKRKPVATDILRIAVIPKGTTHEFWKAIHAGAIKAQGELESVQVIWKGPLKEDDRNGQIDVVQDFITLGVTGIALAPLDDQALVNPVREASRTGIGVVIMDSGLDATVGKDYASFVATDNYVGGRKGAERLGELLDGKGRVIMMRYQEGSASTMQREQGFLDTMASEFPEIQVLSSDQYGGATSASAQTTAENLLATYPEIDGMFTPNESTTFGMLLALRTAERAGKLKFVGFDSSDKLIEALGSDELHGLVLQDPLNMGYTAVKTLVAYLRGEEVQTRIDTGSAVATKENMNDPKIAALLAPPIDQYLP